MSDISSDKLDTTLLALEALSKGLVAKTAPVRFAVAQTPAEREAAFRLRAQALIERGSAQPEDFSDGLECDAHDERALQIIGWDGDQAIATGRIVLPEPGYLLPTEEAFGLKLEPQGEVVDIGRYTVMHDWAQKENRYFTGMLGFCWLE